MATLDEDDSILSMRVGGATIRENLEAAITAGHVVRRADGKFELAKIPARKYFIKKRPMGLNCQFRNEFVFAHLYRKQAVPISCRDCYKLKISPSTLRQLLATKQISEQLPDRSKSGTEVHVKDNQSLYATYFYLSGLEKARALYKVVRELLDTHPLLGKAVKMVIKRGCTNYERNCGPSDRYTFDPTLADIENYFFGRFAKKTTTPVNKELDDAARLLAMARTAYSMGDDTYKDVTGGKELYPPVVNYNPT